MSLSNQDEVIQMLEKLRDYKRHGQVCIPYECFVDVCHREQLSLFSCLTLPDRESDVDNNKESDEK